MRGITLQAAGGWLPGVAGNVEKLGPALLFAAEELLTRHIVEQR